VDLNDWILALHLLSAFALIGAEVLYTILIVASWRSDSPSRIASTMRAGQIGAVLVMVGFAGTIVFGVWLAISLDDYELWDGWVIAAFVLWVIAGWLGQQSGDDYSKAGRLAEQRAAEGDAPSSELAATFGPSRTFWLHVASFAVILLILVDMIWKPGA
jgi:uncharacterized membrane protein